MRPRVAAADWPLYRATTPHSAGAGLPGAPISAATTIRLTLDVPNIEYVATEMGTAPTSTGCLSAVSRRLAAAVGGGATMLGRATVSRLGRFTCTLTSWSLPFAS